MFNIKYGHQTGALLKSFPYKDGAELDNGDWCLFDTATGKLVKQTGVYNELTQGVAFPVYGDNVVRFDSKTMGSVTVAMGRTFHAETDKVAAVSIKAGDPLTLDGGILTKATDANKGTIVGFATTPAINGVVEFVRA